MPIGINITIMRISVNIDGTQCNFMTHLAKIHDTCAHFVNRNNIKTKVRRNSYSVGLTTI